MAGAMAAKSTGRLAELRARVAADKWDADAAAALVSAASSMPADEAAAVLADAAARFPTAARVWRLRADAAMRACAENPASADAARAARDLFEDAVRAAPVAVEVWRDYARWAETAPADADVDPVRIFERAVASVGLDPSSNTLWADYIAFLRRTDTLSETQRRDALRKVYQRAVRTPIQDLETFWTQYRHFEETSNMNKELGRGLLADAQPRYQAARAEWRSRRIRREGLALSTWPVPPRGRPKEATQAAQWRRFISTERGNPHVLDKVSLHQRVVHAYETALVPLYRYPDMWIEYLSYVADVATGKNNDPQEPSAGSSRQGGKSGGGRGGSMSNAQASADSGGVPAKIEDFQALTERAMRALPNCVAVFSHISWIWMREGKSSKALSVLDALVKSSPSPLAYVHLMRLTRRVSGKDAARKVFAKARRDSKGAGPAVYIAAAQMEFVVNKDNKIARNVFEFGLKHYANSALMVREFVEWLWGLGDFDHLRVVLKRVMPSIDGPEALVRALWERWVELEEAVGDVASVESVEKMWRESQSGSRAPSAVADAVRRSRFLGLNGMREEELAIIGGIAGVSSASASVGASGAAASSASGGGRRDPRTGRLVGSSGGSGGGGRGNRGGDAGNTGGSSGSGNGSGNASSGGPGTNSGKSASSGGAGSASFRSGVTLATGSGFEVVEANLRRMSTGMQIIHAPPPDYDTIAQLILNTPNSYASTPAGAARNGMGDGNVGGAGDSGGNSGSGKSSLGANGGSGVNGAMPNGSSGRGGKKRSGEDMMSSVHQGQKQAQQLHQQQQAPPQDLFRARQAAKQSRMR